MNKKLRSSLIVGLALISSMPTFASSIYYREQYITSPRFSIKPAFNTGEGKLVVSPRFSIKPAFNSGLTKYFYSGVFSVLDMPDVNFIVDGKALVEGTKVKDDSEIKLQIDFTNYIIKDEVASVEYYVENITDGTTSTKNSVQVNNYVVDSKVDVTLENLKTYKIGSIVTLNDGMKYEVASIPFKVNEKGLVEFISPKDNVLFEEYITVEFEVANSLGINTYNLYMETVDGLKIKVGDALKSQDTKKSETGEYSVHEYRYKVPTGIKKFKHVVEKID